MNSVKKQKSKGKTQRRTVQTRASKNIRGRKTENSFDGLIQFGMKFQDKTLHCFIRNAAWKRDSHRNLLKYKKTCTITLNLKLTNNHENRLRPIYFSYILNQKKIKKNKKKCSFICGSENIDQQGAITYLMHCNMGLCSLVLTIASFSFLI